MTSTQDEHYQAILHAAYSSRPEATLQYNKDRRKLVRTLDGCDTGVYIGKPAKDAALFRLGHHDPDGEKCEILRSLIITVKTPAKATPAQLSYIDDQLERAFFDLKKHLGVKQMVGHIHGNTKSRHIHILLANSNGRRGLDWGPKFLSALQDFTWTDALGSGRGKGIGKSLGVYPHARKLPVRDLANLLLDGSGKVQPERWKQLVARGDISDFRCRKDGSLISVAHQGKRIRLDQLTEFIRYQQRRLTPTKGPIMPIDQTKPNAPVPPPLAKALAEVGLGADQLAALLKTLDVAEDRSRSIRRPKTKTITRGIPMNLDLNSHDDNEATRKREEADRLFIAQQQNQAKLRDQLHIHMEARQALPPADQKTSLKLLTFPLIGQVHEGSWAELWPFMQDMITLGATVGLDSYIVVLGGWLDTTPATPPTPPELFEELKAYGVPGDILRRINARRTPEDLENIWFMVRNNASLFTAAVVDDTYTIGRVSKVAREQMAQRLLPLQGRFLYLEHRRFWFLPTAADPLLGWADFMAFAVCYHQLPAAFKAQMGPYRITIVPAVIPAAAPVPPL